MNLPRLRTLLAAWQDGSVREAELAELRDALPGLLEELETAVYLLGQSDVKRFQLMKRNGQLETIASRYEMIRLYEQRTLDFLVPCVCGHSSDLHFLARAKCKFENCRCVLFDSMTALEVPGE